MSSYLLALLAWCLVTAGVLFTGKRFLSEPMVRHVVILCILPMPVAQALKDSSRTYPFHHWDMYATTAVPRRYYRFTVQTIDGDERDFSFTAVTFMSPGPLGGFSTLSPIPMRLLQLRTACRCASGDRRLDDSVRSLVAIERATTGVAVRVFRIYQIPLEISKSTARTASPRVIYSWVATLP